VIGDIAATFHFPPTEIWNMDADELLFWHAQAARISEAGRTAGS
jgi:hypothetical protein